MAIGHNRNVIQVNCSGLREFISRQKVNCIVCAEMKNDSHFIGGTQAIIVNAIAQHGYLFIALHAVANGESSVKEINIYMARRLRRFVLFVLIVIYDCVFAFSMMRCTQQPNSHTSTPSIQKVNVAIDQFQFSYKINLFHI